MILLDRRLIYVATPKTATQSIRAAILESGIPFEEFLPDDSSEDRHYHITLSEMISKWGVKESFCLERDWFDRWLSGFIYVMFGYLNYPNLKPKFCAEDIDNNFIYNTFDSELVNIMHAPDKNDLRSIQKKFIYNPEDLIHPGRIKVLCSSKFWKSGKKCTYEFDFKKLDTVKSFFEQNFNCEFSIPVLNSIKSNIDLPNLEINDELRSFVYQTFEKRFNNNLL